MLHLEEGTIHAWLDGELPPEEAERAAQHVAACAECRALVVEARGLLAGASRIVSALDAGPAGVVPATPPAANGNRRPWYRFAVTPARMSIAATILVAAGLTLTARHGAENSSTRGRLIDSQIHPAAQTVSGPTIMDSVSTKPVSTRSPAVDQALGKLKGAPKATTLTASERAAGSSSKVAASPPTVSAAAALEQKTLRADKQFDANSPRQIAAAAAPPAAEPAAPASRADSTRAKDEMAKVAGDSLRRAPAPERRQAAAIAGNANQMQGFVLTERDGNRVSSVLILRDCYRLAVDSTDWRGVLPSGFALDAQSSDLNRGRITTFATGAAGGSAGRSAPATVGGAQPTSTAPPAATPAPVLNAVRALDSSGRVGSAVIGLWFLRQPDTIGVRLSNADANKAVTLLLTNSGSNARVITGGHTDSVRVARTSCPR